MNPQQTQLSPTSALKRRREVLTLTCKRCGHEKPVCDGHPCANCGDQGVVCAGRDCGHPRGVFDKGYVEWLENERAILSLGVQEACRRLIEANLWPTESLPRVGRLLSIRDMLVALGLMLDLKEQNHDDEHSRRKKSKSPHVTAHTSEGRALDLDRHQTTSPSGSSNHGRSHGETPGPQSVHPVYPNFQSTATALASLLNDASLAKHNWPITAIRMPQNPRDSNLGQEGRLWSHTTDAYQQVSGPSNLSKRTSPLMSGSDGVHRHLDLSRQNSGQTSRTTEAFHSGQDETATDSDGDGGEYIKIPF